MGGLIKQWGPSYFEQDDASDNQYSSAASAVAMATQGGVSKSIPRSGGWAYSLPLMASQQYATAMASLADVGGGLGLLQATHVAVVGDAAGLPLNDFIFISIPFRSVHVRCHSVSIINYICIILLFHSLLFFCIKTC